MMQGGAHSKFLYILLILTFLIGIGGVNSFPMKGDEMPTEVELTLDIHKEVKESLGVCV